MAWWVLVDDATGAAHTLHGSRPRPASVPAGLVWVDAIAEPDQDAAIWDTTLRTFVPRPAKQFIDRVSDLQADADFAAVWGVLNAARKIQLARALRAFFQGVGIGADREVPS